MTSALRVLPSAPEMPTALWPYSLRAQTSSWLTLPTRTSRTASMVSSSVTRRPSLNLTGTSRRVSRALMALPPPWTSTTRTPMSFMSSMSATTRWQSSLSSMAEPPYLMTNVLPFIWLIQGSASMRVSALAAAASRCWMSRFFICCLS